ncbi:MAG: autotransporter-associated beta strand repeat-containing protein [Verrucomicrobiaceae bacterium]
MKFSSLIKLVSFRRLIIGFWAVATLCALVHTADAATYYWDNNTTTAGFGTAGGTWADPTLNLWSTDSTGVAAPGASITTGTADALNFGTGTVGNGLGAGTITVSGTVDSGNITFGAQSGAILLSGGTINLAATTTITVDNTTDTISSSLTGLGTRLTKAGTGELVLSGSNTIAANVRVQTGKITLTGSITHSVNQFQVGFGSGNTAIMDISGAGSLSSSYVNSRGIVVGGGAGVTGTLNLSGSGSVSTGSTTGLFIGEDGGGTGLFNQTGGTTSIGKEMWMVGNSSTLSVSGGSFTSNGTNYLAAAGGVGIATTGTINVNGTGSITLGTLNFGQNGRNYTSATVNVGNFSSSSSAGGTFQVNSITYGGGTGASTINFDGGTFVANGTVNTPAAVPVAGATFSTVVKSGGAKIDVTGSNTMTIQTALTEDISSTGGGLTKSNTGTLSLTGADANTYTGTTIVNGGILALGKTAGVNAVGGNLTIGDGATTAGLDIVRLTNSNQIADTSLVTFNGSGSNAGILRLNNQSETLAGLSSTGGAGIVENESGSAATGTLTVSFASGTQTFDGILRNGDGTGTDGTLAFNKTGAGTQVLTGSTNSYTGGTSVTGGTLSFANGALGTTGAITVNGGTLQWNGSNTQDISARLTLQNSGSATLDTNGNDVTLATAFGGSTSSSLTKTGAGSLSLTGAASNTYTGPTTVNGGSLVLGKTANINAIAGNLTIGDGTTTAGLDIVQLTNNNQIANTSVVTFNGTGANAGILRLNNQSETLAGLSSTGGAGIVENESGSAATSTLTVNIASGTQTFSGILRNGDGTGTDGTLAFTKTGAGTQVLSGSSTYTGATNINGGTVNLTGSISTGAGSQQININAAAGASVDISGSGSLTSTYANARAIVVGGASGQSGTINVSGSGSLTTLGMLIGEDSGGTGLVNQTGGTVAIGGNALWMTGNSSTVTVSGGSFSAAGITRFAVGSSVLSTSAINVNGTGSITLGTLQFGLSSRNFTSATVNVGNFSTSSSAGGTIQVNNITYGTTGTGASAINFDGGTFVANGTFSTLAAVPVAGATFSTVVKSGGANISVTGSNTLTIQTALTEDISSTGGGLTKSNTGTLILSGANTYTGLTTVSGGMLTLSNSLALQNSTLDTTNSIASSSTTTGLKTTVTTLTLGGLSGNKDLSSLFNAANGYSTVTALTLNPGTGATPSYSGIIANGASGMTLTKTGNGTQILTGANTYTGVTTISGGSVILGSGTGTTGTGAVTVQTGSTILGTGVVRGTTFTLDNGATLRPGDSAADSSHGTLTFTPASASGSTSSLQGSVILGITTASTVDASYGGNVLGSAGYNAWVDAVSGVGGHDRLVFNDPASGTGYGVNFLTTTGSLQIVGSSFTPVQGMAFNLLDWGNLVTPNFSGFTFNSGYLIGNGDEGTDLDLPDLTGSGLYWDFSRFTTSGVIVIVPEPSRALLLVSGLTGLLLRRRRR